MAILVSGYGLIVVSYGWIWAIASVAGRQTGSPHRRIDAVDVRIIFRMMLTWTAIWLLILLRDLIR